MCHLFCGGCPSHKLLLFERDNVSTSKNIEPYLRKLMVASVSRSEVMVTVVTPRFVFLSTTLNWLKKSDKTCLSLNLFSVWKDCSVSKAVNIELLKCFAVFVTVLRTPAQTFLTHFLQNPLAGSVVRVAEKLKLIEKQRVDCCCCCRWLLSVPSFYMRSCWFAHVNPFSSFDGFWLQMFDRLVLALW